MYGTSSPNPMGGSSAYNQYTGPTGTPQKTTNNYCLTSPAQPQRPNISTGASYALNGRVTSTTTSPSMPQRFPEGYSLGGGSPGHRRVAQQPIGGHSDTPIPAQNRYGSGVRVAASPQEPVSRTTQSLPVEQRTVDLSSFLSPQPQSSQPQQIRYASSSPQAQYPDTPIPGARPQATTPSPQQPRAYFTPQRPVFVLASPDFRQTFSPATPFRGSTAPPAYQTHRVTMSVIRERHKELLGLMEQFGCERTTEFTGYFMQQFPSFMFPKEHKIQLLEMIQRFTDFREIFDNSKDIFIKLMRDYQTYEKLVKMTDGKGEVYSKQLEELEESLNKQERLVKDKIGDLSFKLEGFLSGLFSYMSKSPVKNKDTAFRVFQEMKYHYTHVVKRSNPPRDFAGMDFSYQDLISSARKMRGLGWLDSLVRAALVDHSKNRGRSYNNEPTSVDVQWLSYWAQSKMSSQGRNSPEIEEALLKLKASVGCWDQLVTNGQSLGGTGSSLEVFLRFSGRDTKTINYPLPGLKITPKLQAQFDKLNTERELTNWVREVEFSFGAPEEEGKLKLKSKNPGTSWREGFSIQLKEKAVLIYSLELTVQNPALVAKAEKLAQKIVSHIYTHELTRDEQS